MARRHLADDGDGALRVQSRSWRAPRAPAQARPPGARLRDRPCGHRARNPGGSAGICPSPVGQRCVPSDGALLSCPLGRLPLRHRSRTASARAGGMPPRFRPHLLVRGRASSPASRDDCGHPRSRARGRARTSAPPSGGRRGRADLRTLWSFLRSDRSKRQFRRPALRLGGLRRARLAGRLVRARAELGRVLQSPDHARHPTGEQNRRPARSERAFSMPRMRSSPEPCRRSPSCSTSFGP